MTDTEIAAKLYFLEGCIHQLEQRIEYIEERQRNIIIQAMVEVLKNEVVENECKAEEEVFKKANKTP